MSKVPAPVDAVATPAWAALQKHHDQLTEKGIDLRAWFDDHRDRVEKLSFTAGDLLIDLS